MIDSKVMEMAEALSYDIDDLGFKFTRAGVIAFAHALLAEKDKEIAELKETNRELEAIRSAAYDTMDDITDSYESMKKDLAAAQARELKLREALEKIKHHMDTDEYAWEVAESALAMPQDTLADGDHFLTLMDTPLPGMIELNDIRAEMAAYMAEHPRGSLDSALFYVCKMVYAAGYSHGKR